MKKIIYTIASITLLSTSFVSCSKDSLEPSVVDKENISINPISTEAQLRAAVNGAYKYMSSASYYGRDYIIYNEVHSDNSLSNGNSGRFVNEAEFRTLLTSGYAADTWAAIYQVVAMSNIAINAEVIEGNPDNINAIKAEAYALRALAHFDLMKLYGQQNVTRSSQSLAVPYVTTYGTITAENFTRLPLIDFDAKLTADLDEALALTNSKITVKTAFNKQSILALKARINLYLAPFLGDAKYKIAYDAASEAMALGGTVATASDFVSIFKSGQVGENSVFELQFLSNDNLSTDSLYQIYNATPYGDVYMAREVKENLFANTSDIRGSLVNNVTVVIDEKTKETQTVLRNTGKYVDRADNVKIIRFEEIVLTAAEAAFKTGNISEALTLTNSIAGNRGISLYTSVTLEDIITERRKEFISEGFRFDDLMRLQMDIPQISGRKAENTPAYGDPRLAFPIPQAETNVSPIQQNQGY